MRFRNRVVLTALSAVLALTLTAGLASARTGLEVSPLEGLSATANDLTFDSGLADVICDVTLNGSLHQTIPKTQGALAGLVTSGEDAGCRNSLGTFADATLVGFDWHLTYLGITGELPDIDRGLLLVENTLFRLTIAEPFGSRMICLYGGNIDVDTNGNVSSAGITELIPDADQQIPLLQQLQGAIFADCPEEGRLLGTFNTDAIEVILVD